MRIVALVPMKGHSSRVPGKNFKEFCGKPLFRWILDTLNEIESVSQIVINTDARDEFEKHGLVETDKLIFRQRIPELCGDDVSMNRILEDDIENIPADLYLMTHSTNPLLSADTIIGGIQAFEREAKSGECDSLFSVNRYQTRFYRGDASPINHDPDNLIPTQDLEPWYEENSNLYLFTKRSFEASGARIGVNPMIYKTPKLESSDIDNPEDWAVAEHLASYLNGSSAILDHS